jgi:subtilase family serine protease
MIQRLTTAVLGAAALSGFAAPLNAQEKPQLAARAASSQPVGFDVYLPLQHRDVLAKLLVDLQTSGSPRYHQWLKPAQFEAQFAASPAQVAAVQQQLASYGLTSTVVSPRHIKVNGAAALVENAFNTVIRSGTYSNGKTALVAVTPINLSGALLQSGAVIIGLSNKFFMKPHSRSFAIAQNRYSTAGPYWFDDLKQAYKFPSYQLYAGTGTQIGILMSGDFNPTDMDLYFHHEHLTTPSFTTVQVDGGAPYDPNNSLETHLDLQQSGGMAPKAHVTLYNLPDLSDVSILDGLDQILIDDKVDVVNMSFGLPEIFYTAAYNGGQDFTFIPEIEDEFFAQGNAQGITFVASSGDSGAVAAVPLVCFDYGPNCGNAVLSAEFPASSPHVTGVGGTNLETYHSRNGELTSTYSFEQAYADPLAFDIFFGTSASGMLWGSGGGPSIIFAKPDFQHIIKVPGDARTVPDVAGHMGGCPFGTLGDCSPQDSADLTVIGGILYGVIGTSASAPDFAGLAALTVERFGSRLGNANYYIYTLADAQVRGLVSGVYNTTVPGFNGLAAKNGYDPVTGIGTVNGAAFMLLPKGTALAGNPQTPSNP